MLKVTINPIAKFGCIARLEFNTNDGGKLVDLAQQEFKLSY